MRRKAFVPFKRGKATATVILVSMLLLVPMLVLTMTLRSKPAEASPDTFGYQPGGSPSNWQSVEDRITGSWFTPTSSGTVTSITAYVFDPEGPDPYKFAIHDNSDNSLVGYTEAGYAGEGWKTLNITSGGAITGGVDYYLVAWGADANNKIGYDDNTGKGAYDSETYNGFPDPWVPITEDKKCWIYATYTPAIPPTKPVLISPDNATSTSDNTPTFVWENGTGADNNRIEVDNDFDFGSVIDNETVLDNTWTKTENGYAFGTYYWRIWAVNAQGENMSENTWEFTILTPPSVTTENATNIGVDNATFNSTISYGGHDNVDIRFRYKSDRYGYAEGENENWSLSDWYYPSPTDPAEANNWGDRTPVMYVAASDSSQADKDFVTAQGENGFQADGDNDQLTIMSAITTLKNTFGCNLQDENQGKVYMFDGTYYLHNYLQISGLTDDGRASFISLVGESKENTILSTEFTTGAAMQMRYDNWLLENFTLRGRGRYVTGEQSGMSWSGDSDRDLRNIVIRNVIVKDWQAVGIYFEMGSTYDLENIWIVDSEVSNTGVEGISISWDNPMLNVYIENNILNYCGLGSLSYTPTSPISLDNITGGLFINNIIENSGAWALKAVDLTDFLFQGNRFRANSLENVFFPALRVMYLSDNIIFRGNDIDQLYGVQTWASTSNLTFDNNSFYNTAKIIQDNENLGTGHVYNNNVEPYYPANYYTSWETITQASYSKNVDNLYGTDYYGRRGVLFEAEIRYNSTIAYGDNKTFTSFYSEIVLVSPENNSTIYDNTPTFEWSSTGFPYWSNLIVDNDSDFTSPEISENIEFPTQTFTPSSELTYDNYWWKIVDNFGDNSGESGVFNFMLEFPNWSPTVENIFITDTDNAATDNLITQTQYNFLVEIEDNDTLEDIDNVTVRVYLDNIYLTDNETNHYTFRFINSTGVWSSSPPGYIITENCVSGDNAKNTDNYIFAIKFDDAAIFTDNNGWDVQVEIYDTLGSQDEVVFENRFDIGFEGSGTVEYPYLIPNVELLQKVDNYKTFHFALQNDIDASATAEWNGGAGFVPIGDNDNKFVGSLDGHGYIIYDLFINRDSTNFVGVFGSIGGNSILENVGIDNENITGNNYVGGFVGYSDGIISRCYSAGYVVGDNYVGGLVGFNTENVINTYSSSSVTGDYDVGGLVGHNNGLVNYSYSVGPVVGNYNVGGIVGYEISYEGAWYEVETWTNYMDVAGIGWWEVEIWTNYMDATGIGWHEVETWTNYMDAGPTWRVVAIWTNYIDSPTETTFYSMDDDGYITNQAASYIAVHDNTVGYALTDSSDRLYIGQVFILEYEIKRSFVYFDTSGIPDTATIQSATLSLYGRTDSSAADFDIVIQNGQPTYPRDPLVLEDYYYAYYGNTDGGVFNTSGFTTSGYNEITLNENALTWINKTGTTKFALRSDNDIYSITPTEYEYVSVYSFEKGPGYRPMLTISYTTGTVSNSFYDNQTSGQSDTGKGLGLSTAQMQQISTFLDNGWDIVLRENYVDETWYIDNGDDYPRLGWEAITPGWYEVGTWTNYMNTSVIGWHEVGTWTNYAHVLNWYEVAVWTNYAKRSTWYEVETWNNNVDSTPVGWWEVETWTNYVDTVPPAWYEVGTWTNYMNASPPGWYEVETWTNYMNASPPGWYEVGTWANYLETPKVVIPPAEDPSVWVTIIRILGIIGFLGWAGWKFKNIDDPGSGIEAGLTVVIAFLGIVIMWFVAEAIGAVASGL